MIHLFRQCARFHELLLAFMVRELKARYRGSILGTAWMVLQPLMYLGVYYMVFVKLLDSKAMAEPADSRPDIIAVVAGKEAVYSAFGMLIALIPWISFSETIMRGTGCILESGSLIKKFAFPSELLPVYLVGVGLFNTLIGLTIAGIAVPITLGFFPENLWLLPIVLFFQGMLSLGLVYFVSAATVFLRDLAQIVPMLMTFGFFLSPIFYTRPISPEYGWILGCNPITWMMDLYRRIFIAHPGVMNHPSIAGWSMWTEIAALGTVSVVVLILGLAFFRSLKLRFADEI